MRCVTSFRELVQSVLRDSGVLCNEECGNHTFGLECKQKCGNCRNKEQCNHVDGSCLNGCDSGFFGGMCHTKCPLGWYGHSCRKNCSINCMVSSDCDRVTGRCTQGYQSGWEGDRCVTKLQRWESNVQPTIATLTVSVLVTVVIIIVVTSFAIIQHRIQLLNKGVGMNSTPREEIDLEDDFTTRTDYSELLGTDTSVNVASILNIPSTIENSEMHFFQDMSEIKHDSSSVSIDDGDQGNRLLVKDITNIKIHELQFVIDNHALDNGEGFKREYELLSAEEQYECCVGKRPENVPKNRYKTILPYDQSRVILMTDAEYTDYINANYVKDNDGKIAYIATQGPKGRTINDFRLMVWQENVTQIVMLTNLIEGGKVKCKQYWPEYTDGEFYGNISIRKYEETQYTFYIIRKFNMSHNEGSRNVTQYHFTKWPDHGTPDPLSLVFFHSHVLRTRPGETQAPTVVHCSGGIGRTGTYIAFDALCKEGKSKGTINVASYVKVMRSYRMNMVQTYEQYKAIYLALDEEFKAPVRTKSISAFRESMNHFFGEDSTDHVIFEKEFKSLSDIKPACTKMISEMSHYTQ
uniref:protein-tyrosine-phosphatase n=1 Tax=Crassostrea virginica TaxID=6565 RepID=A0A8B8BU16_CRAVI|nr:receptor-type tyrosine-protein phosphatase alpha-like [Crassostrea virginica]